MEVVGRRKLPLITSDVPSAISSKCHVIVMPLSKLPHKMSKFGDNDNDLISHISNRLRNDVPDAIVVGWKIWVPSMTIMFA